jgi:hypothetical protein
MLHHLDDLINFSLSNLDDEHIAVGRTWAETIGKCCNAAVVVNRFQEQEAGVTAAKREVEDEEADSSTKSKKKSITGDGPGLSIKFQLRKSAQSGDAVSSCTSTHASINFLAGWFKKVGGGKE